MDAVLNWLWQGSVLALAAAALLRLMKRVPARARYSVLWTAWLSVLMLPVVPLFWAGVPSTQPVSTTGAEAAAVVAIPSSWWTSRQLTVAAWALWVVIGAVRLGWDARAVRRSMSLALPFSAAVEARLTHWMRVRGRGLQTRLVVSDRVRAAAVLGCGSPVIAVAPTLLDRLTDEELDDVIVHEWAHVQRRDDWANALQQLGRVVAGWHPAIWWIDAQLHIEREVACDAMATSITGSPKRYAHALTTLASLPRPAVRPLPAVGAVSSQGLRRRVQKILDRDAPRPPFACRTLTLVAALGLCVFSITISGWDLIGYSVSESAQAYDSIAPTRSTHADTSQTPAPAAMPSTMRQSMRSAPPLGKSRKASRETLPANTRSGAIPIAQAEPRIAGAASGEPDSTAPARRLDSVASLTAHVPLATSASTASDTEPRPEATSYEPADAAPTPWQAAASGGVAVGRGSKKAAVATAGFFNRFAKRIATEF